MTDMRRTLLWVVFTMSLVLLWDAWNKHNGQPSMFGPPAPATRPAETLGAAPDATPAAGAGLAFRPVPRRCRCHRHGGDRRGAGARPGRPRAAERSRSPPTWSRPPSTRTVALLARTRLELLQQGRAVRDCSAQARRAVRPVGSSSGLYLSAQTGLITTTRRRELADPSAPMTWSPGERSVEGRRQNQLQVCASSRAESTA